MNNFWIGNFNLSVLFLVYFLIFLIILGFKNEYIYFIEMKFKEIKSII